MSLKNASRLTVFFRKDEQSMLSKSQPSSSSQTREQQAVQFPPSPEQARRTGPTRSAPFNPEDLGGPLNAPDVYSADDGVYRVNIAMFEPPQPTSSKGAREISTSKTEPAYIIPRPIVDPEPAVIHGRVSPIPDYVSEESSSTHM